MGVAEWIAVVLALAVAGMVAVTWSAVRGAAARDAAAPVPVAPSAPDPALVARVEALERSIPEYRIAMEQIADRCDEVLDAADKKRRRAQSIANREQVADQAEPQPQTREEQIRLVRSRYGQ